MARSNPYALIAFEPSHNPGGQNHQSNQQASKKRVWLFRFGLIAALAVVLVFGALYGPVLWEQASAEAGWSRGKQLATGSGAANADFQASNLQTANLQTPDAQAGVSLVDGQDALAELYHQAAPSIVNIQVTSRGSRLSLPGFGLPDDDDPPLRQGVGSGFIYDEQGHIVTNNHVVEDAEEVLVVFNNGYWAEADVVAADPQADLAVIQVTPPEELVLQPLPLAKADTLRVGHTVIAIGNPFGLAGTMTSGIVSALGRGIPLGDDGTTTRYTLPDVIQTDAAINPGNSGGPLLDLNGAVVGVNFAIRSQMRANVGVGFAIPVSILRRVVPSLIEQGRYPYAYLGLRGSTINAELADILDLSNNQLGVYVSEVLPHGPSSQSGLQGGDELVVDDATGIEFEKGGDIVTAIDGNRVVRFEDLVSYLVTEATPGQSVILTVLRNGETLEIPVTLGERPAATGSAQSAFPEDELPEDDEINAREAIAIAAGTAEEAGMLSGEVVDRLATPDEQDGLPVWVVELATESETVVAIIDARSGEVLEVNVR